MGGHEASWSVYRKRRLAEELRWAKLLKKISSSWSLSKSAAMTVRTGEGMENLGEAMSWEERGLQVSRQVLGRAGVGETPIPAVCVRSQDEIARDSPT